ncbi:hypothetical protein [Paenibacillus ferrarius]
MTPRFALESLPIAGSGRKMKQEGMVANSLLCRSWEEKSWHA